jgi:hypothetical protein
MQEIQQKTEVPMHHLSNLAKKHRSTEVKRQVLSNIRKNQKEQKAKQRATNPISETKPKPVEVKEDQKCSVSESEVEPKEVASTEVEGRVSVNFHFTYDIKGSKVSRTNAIRHLEEAVAMLKKADVDKVDVVLAINS